MIKGKLGPLDRSLGFKLRLANNLMIHEWAALARSEGIAETPVEGGIVVLIGSNPGLAHGTLADLLGVDASTLSQALNPLISRGLIRREPDPSDRRTRRMYLTNAGELARHRITGILRIKEENPPGALNADELSSLHGLLDKLLEDVAEEDSVVELQAGRA